jgi:hypothetical protein
MARDIQIQLIKEKLFNLCKQAEYMELIHGYVLIDDCFLNGEFLEKDADNLRYQIQILFWQNTPIGKLLELINPVLKKHGLVAEDGKWIKRTTYQY